MKTIKRSLLALLTASLAVFFVACSDDNGDNGPETPAPGLVGKG